MAMQSASYPFRGFKTFRIEEGPRIPIRVWTLDKKKAVIVYALIDTGASICVFPAELAIYLDHRLDAPGVKIHQARTFHGEKVPTYRHTFFVEILGPDHQAVIASNEMLVPCVPGLGDPLLGVTDCLRTFSVTVDYLKQHTELQWKAPRGTLGPKK